MIFDLYTNSQYWYDLEFGAWSYIIKNNIKNDKLSKWGIIDESTINRCELTAIIDAFREIPEDVRVILYTSNNYIFDGILKYRFAWAKKEWKDVKNADLWKEVDEIMRNYQIDVKMADKYRNDSYDLLLTAKEDYLEFCGAK